MKNKLTEHVQSTNDSELAVFFDEIGKNLPKSIERSALGDEKIFRAFEIAYPQIKSYIQLKTIELVKEELEGEKKNELSDSDIQLLSRHEREDYGEEVVGFNSALSTAITLLDTIIQDIKLQMK